MKVVLGGPPRSGKSCLREGLKQAIRGIPGAPYPLVITACPDGEGSWYQETARRHPEKASRHKASYKGKFTQEYVDEKATQVANCRERLTMIDVGGKVDAYNEQICATATHIILLADDLERLSEWRDFSARLGLKIIAELHSDYEGSEDLLPSLGDDGVYRGSVHHLERGEPVGTRPTIQHLADILVQLAN